MTRAQFLEQLNKIAEEIMMDRISAEDDEAEDAIHTLAMYISDHMTDEDRCWS